MPKGDIEKDDPLGDFFGKGKGKKESIESDSLPEPEIEDDGTMAAQAFLDAVHAKDAAAVRDAFSALSLSMKPPGEDDMEMIPESALEE